MRKIGILTLQNADNYGAMCQMLALHYTIEKIKKGVSEIINVSDLRIENRYRLLRFSNDVKYNIKQIIFLPFNFITSRKFKKFRKKAKYSHLIEIDSLKKLNYDTIIVGSDQVWNITLTGKDSIYFLKWFSGKKYSYAASFGVSEFDEEFDIEIDKLKSFEKISVREMNAVSYLSNRSIEAQINIDPSFLLDKDEWSSLAIIPKIKHYILIYTIGYSDDIVKFAKELSNKNGNIPICYISNDIVFKDGIKIRRAIGPAEWVGYFCNADFVVTNSFHGLAFALNFNVDFYYNDAMTTSKDTNARIKSLLDTFEVSGRCISEGKTDRINWTKVNRIIKNEKGNSVEYLRTIVE